MIPEGLVLLTSATFIVSIVKLAQYDTLVQQLSATEILARVDVLCVDKTGTITEGKLKLSEVKLLGDYNKEKVDEIDPEAFVIVTDAREVHGEGFIEKK